MKKAIIVPNPNKDTDLRVTSDIVKRLGELGIKSLIDRKYESPQLTDVEYFNDNLIGADIIVVVGGDGSVIDASCLALSLDIPLLGINLGKVGYLTQLDPSNLSMLERLRSGVYQVDGKMLLTVEKQTAIGATRCERLAVNDVVVSHENYLGISSFMIESEHGDHVMYRADAVIASTPAGSTAYSFSAGGPVISHTLDSITLTPVCPHSFFNRAIVYGPNERILISNAGESVLNISVDGRYFDSIAKSEGCAVYMSNKRLKMITFTESNVFTVLSKKINHLGDMV